MRWNFSTLLRGNLKQSTDPLFTLVKHSISHIFHGVILTCPSKHVAIKVISSYTEDQIITSDPSQILSIKKAKEDLERIEAEEKK